MPELAAQRLKVWLGGLGVGVRTLRREPVLGAKRLILPVSYWRTAEFAFVAEHIRVAAGASIVDLGSPKDLALLLARRDRARVLALDILEDAIALSRRYAAAQRMEGVSDGQVESRLADGRELPLESDSFDAAFSVSVLEHIPDDGDSRAIHELARVLRPGGLLAVTVPFSQAARDTFVRHRVYERDFGGGEPVFFERHYDHESLQRRLIGPSRLVVERLEIWGEPRVRGEHLIKRAGRLGLLLAPLEPAMSLAFLDRVREDSPRAMAAFLLLRKPESEWH
jgi:SAM-dependent methyltransferase